MHIQRDIELALCGHCLPAIVVQLRTELSSIPALLYPLLEPPGEKPLDIKIGFVVVTDSIDHGKRTRRVDIKRHAIAGPTADRIDRPDCHDRFPGTDEPISNLEQESLTQRESPVFNDTKVSDSPGIFIYSVSLSGGFRGILRKDAGAKGKEAGADTQESHEFFKTRPSVHASCLLPSCGSPEEAPQWQQRPDRR